jgi:group II intron reverse transcriptase/maturase
MRNADRRNRFSRILRERGRRGLPLSRVYRQLFNPELYLKAYGKIYRNQGALTPGVDPETVDGMTLAKIEAIIDALRHERYRWKPARRTYIAKKQSAKKRPLGLPTWSDKLLQEVIRMLLEAYYEPQFSDHSHGFRPRRGCHTALQAISRKWQGTIWFLEGDISRCFDSLDHEVLLSILQEKIKDNRFLRLIRHLLAAGYLEEWRLHKTLSGTPQGGIVSPVLANLYLDRLDQYAEKTLLPAHNRGQRRKANPEYARLISRAWKKEQKGHRQEAKALRKQAQRLPAIDPHDPDFRRLRYVRYADDFLLGFIGPRQEAEEIKRHLGEFLCQELKLELSEEKTLITHAKSETARFLGYEIGTSQNDTKQAVNDRHQRSVNGRVELKVPQDVLRAKRRLYEQAGKPIHRRERAHESEYTIVASYQQEYRGLVEYYRRASNLRQLGTLKWVMEMSLVKTLANKRQCRMSQVRRRYGTTLATANGPRKGLRVIVERGEGKKPLVAQWGGISLRREKEAILNDQPPQPKKYGTELLERLLAQECELCQSEEEVEVHHVRALKDLQKKGRKARPEWIKRMAARHRKTLIVCRACHEAIHAGRPTREKSEETLESRMR